MMRLFRDAFQTSVALFWALVLRLGALSLRRDQAQATTVMEHLASGKPCIFVFWHQKYLVLLAQLRGSGITIFTSDSMRGNIIARMCRILGFSATVIPDQGGETSYRTMREALRTRRAGAIAVDGPLGPLHFVHRGALRLASELGFTLIPISGACHPGLVMRKRWDRLEVPLPFSRVIVLAGRALTVPPVLSEAEIQGLSSELRQELETADNMALSKIYCR